MTEFSNVEIALFQQLRRLLDDRGFLVSDADLNTSAPAFKYFFPGRDRIQEGWIRLDAATRTAIMHLQIQTRVQALHDCILSEEFLPGRLDLLTSKEEIFPGRPRRKKSQMKILHKRSKAFRGLTSIQLPQRIHSF